MKICLRILYYILCIPVLCMSMDMQSQPKDIRYGMYMEYPAVDWREALPTGNGDIGAMLYGNVICERVMLNHKRWFYRRKHQPLPDFSGYLPELRRIIDEGRYEEADKFFMGKIRQSGYANTRSGEFQPGFDLEVRRQSSAPFTDYGRALDFETGEAKVSWKEDNRSYERSLFVSRADDVVVLQLTARQAGHISEIFSFSGHDVGNAPKSLETDLVFHQPVTDGHEFMTIYGQRKDDDTIFGAVARIVPVNGSITSVKDSRGEAFEIKQADAVLVLIRMFYKGLPESRFDEMKQALLSLPADYEVLLQRHTAIHRELFLRCTLDLKADATGKPSNERLLLDAYKGRMSNEFAERMFHYGRFLLICSSNPDGLPANLQGVWNGLYAPPWQGSFFFNENIQMNYWQALPGNMPEVLFSLFNLVESGIPDFRENACKYYGCRGVLAPIRMIDDFGKKTGAIAQDVFFTGGAGWLAQFFYDYWLFTGDDNFLGRHAVPYMKEVALFYEDFVQTDTSGKLKMYPSDSPENRPAERNTQLCINATIDFAIMKELLTNLVDACTYLKIEKEAVSRWKRLLLLVPSYQVNEDGAIREWMHPDFQDNYHHRHLSHLYPLFPGLEINNGSDTRLFDACRVAVEKRSTIGIESQTGWSLAHMANIYARLGLGDEAWECLNLMSRSTIGSNLFTYHNDERYMGIKDSRSGTPAYQVDANLGFSAAVLEMLVYSNKGTIKLLPALPVQWKDGSVKGVRCRGGFEVDLEWNNHKLQHLSVTSCTGRPCNLHYDGKSRTLDIPKGKTILLDDCLNILKQ
ncbi:MAG: glycoside hydrolase N-terminal domain-containing protein [Mangrovibacterium sp.]